MESVLQDTVLNVAKNVEKQIDEEIYRLENLDLDSIEKLREDHLKKLKAKAKRNQELKALVIFFYYLFILVIRALY